MIPLDFWSIHVDEDDSASTTKKTTVHGHCWLCNQVIFQDVYETIRDDSTHQWHCTACDVREHAPSCSCGVQPVSAA